MRREPLASTIEKTGGWKLWLADGLALIAWGAAIYGGWLMLVAFWAPVSR